MSVILGNLKRRIDNRVLGEIQGLKSEMDIIINIPAKIPYYLLTQLLIYVGNIDQ